MIRAKFKVRSVKQDDGFKEARTIVLSPQYDDSIPEDKRYHSATPSGELTLYVTVPAVIEQLVLGKYFYLDLTPVEEKEK